jgi:hypothetical protein
MGRGWSNFKEKNLKKSSPHFHLDFSVGASFLKFSLFGQVVETCRHLILNPSSNACN